MALVRGKTNTHSHGMNRVHALSACVLHLQRIALLCRRRRLMFPPRSPHDTVLGRGGTHQTNPGSHQFFRKRSTCWTVFVELDKMNCGFVNGRRQGEDERKVQSTCLYCKLSTFNEASASRVPRARTCGQRTADCMECMLEAGRSEDVPRRSHSVSNYRKIELDCFISNVLEE